MQQSLLCGFTSEKATGETFASLGIEGSFTDRAMSGYLDQKTEKREGAAIYLKNQTKDGKPFVNYLRVTPLTDHSTNEITHFLGVLLFAILKQFCFVDPMMTAPELHQKNIRYVSSQRKT
jgi:hypothetical protein